MSWTLKMEGERKEVKEISVTHEMIQEWHNSGCWFVQECLACISLHRNRIVGQKAKYTRPFLSFSLSLSLPSIPSWEFQFNDHQRKKIQNANGKTGMSANQCENSTQVFSSPSPSFFQINVVVFCLDWFRSFSPFFS